MICEAAALPVRQTHGPVASAIKWTFKSYLRTRRALGEVAAQALAEAHARTPAMQPASPAAAAKSVADVGMRVCWVSSVAVEECQVEELGALLGRDDGFVWVDVPTVDDAAEQVLTDVFGVHPLAVRDCREPGHVPKVHAYADHLFLMLQAPEREPNGQIRHRALNQFVGSRYLVTVDERLDATPIEIGQPETGAVLGRGETGHAHPRTPAELSYAIITRLAVRMETLVSELARSVAALSKSVGEGRGGVSEAIIDDMFELRDALLTVEAIAGQNHATCARMATLTTRFAPPEPHPLILDATDQFERIRELCQGTRELLEGILDFSRTRATTKMDRAMSMLALLSAVALPVSLIADLYGMNVLAFQQIPLNVIAMMLGAMVLFTLGIFRLAMQ
jgi:Mg2+ and Co2+ transporter CorA